MKESNSIITLDTDKFEPRDSPKPRILNHSHSHHDVINSSSSYLSGKETNSDKVQPATRSAWKNAILRKASIRTKRAPLADFEDITPSLRSSWSSMYFNQTQSDESESDGLSYYSDTV